MSLDDLLQPSLQDTNSQTIYSVGALFAAAFFGGFIAVCIIATLNAKRLNALAQDFVWILAAFLIGLGAFWYTVFHLATDDSSTTRLINRGVAFVLVGAFYFLYKRQYRSMSMLGGDPPSPYSPVIIASVIGIACTYGMFYFSIQLGTSHG